MFDGNGAAGADAMIEIWQANAAGRYASLDDARDDVPIDPHFIGFGRSSTSADGVYRFRTVRPGRVPGPGNSLQAPHLAVSVFGRGLIKRLATRLYFADGEGNDTRPGARRGPRRSAGHADRRASRRRHVVARYPPAGRARDGVLRPVNLLRTRPATTPAMLAVFDDAATIAHALAFEVALARASSAEGLIPGKVSPGPSR